MFRYALLFLVKAKIVFIGAGSTVFALNILRDICWYQGLSDIELVLFDIDSERLQTTLKASRHLLSQVEGTRNLTARATTDRADALKGARFVLVMFQIGGYRPGTVRDFDIPKKYGLRQTIGDTLGIGGIMRGLRTIAVLDNLTMEMERLCPHALLINYANPMAMNCWALGEWERGASVGLCHSIPITTEQLAADLQLPCEELNYVVAGINHLAFYLKLEHNGRDLYPDLHAFMKSSRFPPKRDMVGGVDMVDHTRYELLRHTGYFVTESSEHLAEYLPYFIKSSHPDLVTRFSIPLDEYPRRCEAQIVEWNRLREQLEEEGGDGSGSMGLEIKRSNDYGVQIIESIINDNPREVYCNVRNDGSIANLPSNAVVEVPCVVRRSGVLPTRVGEIPPHLAGLMRTNINVQELTVRAALEKRRDYVYHAAMLDPHTAAELSLDDIRRMVDELLAAHGDFLGWLA